MRSDWPVVTEFPALKAGRVHVWLLDQNLPADRIERLRTVLTVDEIERADRFKFAKHRRRFVACRGQVREILAHYLQDDPTRIAFEYGPNGKPALAEPWSKSQLEFNVSNSEELSLIAVAFNRPLGVDIEFIKPPHDFEAIARHFFAPVEVAVLDSLTGDARLAGFFDCWTRKEAVLKAVGAGLSISLNKVVVSIAPGRPAAVLRFLPEAGEQPEWWMQNLQPHPGYAAAIAAEGGPLETDCWQWT